jgi:hypothetical protein
MEMNRHLPAALLSELADHFTEGLGDDPGQSPFDRCEALADATDVLHEQYDEENDPLDAGSWSVIASAVSDLALDLDMGFVTYVMKLAVDRGAL